MPTTYDPYAPFGPNTESPVRDEFPKEEPAVEAVAEETAEPTTIEVPEGSISAIMKWVGTDVERAKAALAAEQDGQQRSTLIAKLEAVID